MQAGGFETTMRRHLLSSTNLLSPLFAGVSGGGGIAVGLLLHAALPIGDYTPPLWAWLAALLVVPGAGLVLHITMRRVVYIKMFFAAVLAMATLAYGHLVLLVVTIGANSVVRLLIAMLIAVALACVSIQTYVIFLKAPERSTMPHEEIGVLDSANGLVDLSRFPPEAERWHRRWDKMTTLTRSLLPLIAGLAMLFVRSLSASGDVILVVLCASVMAVGTAVGVGRHLGFAVASRRWEEQHGMAIIIKRP